MRRHVVSLATLLALSCAVQAWCVLRAVTPAQDAVRYVLAAKALERDGLRTMLCEEQEHPLFPALVWATHRLVSPWFGQASAVWPTSAQFAAAAPLVLAVLPLYGFLLSVVRWRAALAGTLFFCVCPAVARLGADGISDSTHLCLLCVALWAAAKYWHQSGRPTPRAVPLWLIVAGAASACAALARQEALLFTPVVCCALVLWPGRAAWRPRWNRILIAGLCLCLGTGAVLVPYLVAAGAMQPRWAVARLLGRPKPAEADASSESATRGRRSSRWRTADGQRMNFAKKDPAATLRFHGPAAAALEFVRELAAAFYYVLAALAVLGLSSFRRRLPRPIDGFLGLFVVAYSLAALYVASLSGYLAPRHLLPIVVVSLGWAGEGAWEAGCWLARAIRISHCALRTPHSALRIPHSALPWLAVTLVALSCLPRTMSPLHASRLGHRQAAAWLEKQARSGDVVLDTRGWSRLYTDLQTYSYQQAEDALREARLAFIVLEEPERHFDSRRGQTLREVLSCAGERVGRFAPDHTDGKAVEIYRWYPERFAARCRGERLAN